jgi:type II secretory pathway pseudopilin PulG
MRMSPSLSMLPTPLRAEHGFTLVEMLVAMVAGMIVILATLSILDISISQSSRISERVDADQRGRLAMEKLMLELHSSCIAFASNPVEPGSTDTNIKFVSQSGNEAYFTSVTKHEVFLNTATHKLTDASYLSTNTAAELGTSWNFPAVATSSQPLLTGAFQTVVEGATIPVFRYYKYQGGNISTVPETTPLSELDAKATAEVSVNFTTSPSSERIDADRKVELTNTAVLRYDPSSATGTNKPCE